jgi:hypothetical protein
VVRAGLTPLIADRGASPQGVIDAVKAAGYSPLDIRTVVWDSHGTEYLIISGGEGTNPHGAVFAEEFEEYFAPFRETLSPGVTWLQASCNAARDREDGGMNVAQAIFEAIPQIDSLYAAPGKGAPSLHFGSHTQPYPGAEGKFFPGLFVMTGWSAPGFASDGRESSVRWENTPYNLFVRLNPDIITAVNN